MRTMWRANVESNGNFHLIMDLMNGFIFWDSTTRMNNFLEPNGPLVSKIILRRSAFVQSFVIRKVAETNFICTNNTDLICLNVLSTYK